MVRAQERAIMFELTVTFDNGPEPSVTPQVLDVLARHGVASTFFVIGGKLLNPQARACAQRAHSEGDQQMALTICNSVCMYVFCVSLLPYPERQNFSAFTPTLCVVGNAEAKSSRAGLLEIFAATTSLIFASILSTLRLRLRVRPWLTRVYQAMTKKKIWSGKSKFLKAIAQRKDGLSSLLPTLALA